MRSSCLALLLAFALTAPAAHAEGGHSLLGVGPVNSAMGGAGVAFADDPQAALLLNPALLTGLDGNRFELSAEYSTQKSALESRVATPIGAFSGRTEDSDKAVIPGFGWTHHDRGSRLAYGMGFFELPGFGVDYAQDSTNPLLAPQPSGFGRTSSSYRHTRLDFVTAWQATDSFSIGVVLNAGRAQLAADSAGFAAPDCSGPVGPCFFPRVAAESVWGFGAGVGAHYKVRPWISLGLSYNTETNFSDFEWSSAHANPNLPTFGTDRRISLGLDAPAVLVAGIAITPSDRLAIAIDGKQIAYGSADGYKDVLGYDDVTVLAAGVQWRATDRFTLRAGYSTGDNPITEDRTFFTVQAPAIVESSAAIGFGLRLNETLELNAAYYRGFENSISGAFFGTAGPVPGTTVTSEVSTDSVLMSMSFRY